MTEPSPSGLPLDRQSLGSALGLVLFGGPLVVIDVTVSQLGGIDLLNDTLGYVLLLWSALLLVRVSGPSLYTSRMRAVGAITALALPWSVVVQARPELKLSVVDLVMSGIAVLAMILFCAAMRDLCAFHAFPSARRSWGQATRLVAIFIGGAWLVGVAVRLAGSAMGSPFTGQTTFEVDGPAVILFFLLLAVLLIPMIFVLAAIGTLRRELRTGSGQMQPQPR
jgi:hypothetical protein